MPRTRALILTAAVMFSLAACGSDANKSTGSSTMVRNTFVLREWSINAPTNRLHAGETRLTASNQGHETHELVIVRAPDAAALPAKSDGSVDEDKIPEADKVGEIADLAAAKTATKTFKLTPGNYVAICNLVDQMGTGTSGGNGGMGGGMGQGGMSGSGMSHIHYRLGMVTTFSVT